MKKYYSLLEDSSEENQIVPDKEELYNIDKVFKGADSIYSVEQYFIYQGKKVVQWDERNKLIVNKNGVWQDYLACAIGWPLLSEKFKKILADLKIDDVQFLPISIENTKTNISKIYYVLNILRVIDNGYDLANTEHMYEKDANGKDVLFILDPKPKVIYEKINKYDIFRIREGFGYIYISERIKELLVKNNITGVDFQPVITV